MQYNVTQAQFELKVHQLKLEALRKQQNNPSLTFKFNYSEFADTQEFIITNGVLSTVLQYDAKRQTLSETTITMSVVEKLHKMKEDILFKR